MARDLKEIKEELDRLEKARLEGKLSTDSLYTELLKISEELHELAKDLGKEEELKKQIPLLINLIKQQIRMLRGS